MVVLHAVFLMTPWTADNSKWLVSVELNLHGNSNVGVTWSSSECQASSDHGRLGDMHAVSDMSRRLVWQATDRTWGKRTSYIVEALSSEAGGPTNVNSRRLEGVGTLLSDAGKLAWTFNGEAEWLAHSWQPGWNCRWIGKADWLAGRLSVAVLCW